MESHWNHLQHFYKENKIFLEDTYPGLKFERVWQSYHQLSGVDKEELYLGQYQEFFDGMARGVPLEYLVEESFFYRSPFYVNKSVLIPRSETEILVEKSLEYINESYHSNYRIAEVGVGSFAIGLSILMDFKRPLSFWGGDICEDALSIAKINLNHKSYKIDKESQVELALSDRIEKAEGAFDFIVSNPPYIRLSDKVKVHKQVQSYEPERALYIEDELYDTWFDDFLKEVNSHLTTEGAFFMEGDEDTLESVAVLAKPYFKSCNIVNDYAGRQRFLFCYKG